MSLKKEGNFKLLCHDSKGVFLKPPNELGPEPGFTRMKTDNLTHLFYLVYNNNLETVDNTSQVS